jgi:hypothetical protein
MSFSVLRRIDAAMKSDRAKELQPIPEPAITPNPADAAAGKPAG